MEKENRVEVFAYNVWNLCDKCETLFFAMIESFFNEPTSRDTDKTE